MKESGGKNEEPISFDLADLHEDLPPKAAEKGTQLFFTEKDALEFDPLSEGSEEVDFPSSPFGDPAHAAGSERHAADSDPQALEFELSASNSSEVASLQSPVPRTKALPPTSKLKVPEKPAPVLPDLEVPALVVPPSKGARSVAPPASAPPSVAAAPSSVAPPSLSLPEDSAQAAGKIAELSFDDEDAPAAIQTPLGAQFPRPSQFPPAPPAVPPSRAVAASSHAPSYLGRAGEVDLGDDLDDLDFGGAAAAQLNVAVPMMEREDTTPWPLGRTPNPDELEVSDDEVRKLSGFGPTPLTLLQAPMYYVRVALALRSLREHVREAQGRLRRAEDSRDERLAELAESKREVLKDKERFTRLYENVARHDRAILEKQGSLESVDTEGASALRELEVQLATLGEERLVKQRARDAHASALEQGNRDISRAEAALRRVQIQNRNLEMRAAKLTTGNEVPGSMQTLYEDLDAHYARAEKELAEARAKKQGLQRLFDAAEDDLHLAVATYQRKEGEKEGLLLAYEGDMSQISRELDQARRERLRELAEAGRVLLELRGQVEVSPEVRRDLLTADEAVAVAARHAQTAERALASMDPGMYSAGRNVWALGAVVLLVLLLALAL